MLFYILGVILHFTFSILNVVCPTVLIFLDILYDRSYEFTIPNFLNFLCYTLFGIENNNPSTIVYYDIEDEIASG